MKTILHFNSIENFTTKRLLAQKIQASDLEKFRMIYTNEQIMRTLGGVCDEAHIIEKFKWNLQQWDDNGFGLWMFYLKDTHEWVGRAGLRRLEVGGNTEIEVGYVLLPQFWRQGLATEMAQACIEIAFEVIRLDNIVGFTLVTNKLSQRVMEKCGFNYERDVLHQGVPHFLYRLKNSMKVVIVSYDDNWQRLFAIEAEKIKAVLGPHLKRTHHIGSTAIPDMPAKPVIDMILECENIDDIHLITKKLNTLNYYNIRRHIIPHRSFFTRRQDQEISYHLHIRERGDPQIKRHILFRDYLIQHQAEAKDYANLKSKLADQFTDNSNQYVFGKDKFVQQIDRKAKLWYSKDHDFLPQNSGPRAEDWSHEKLVKAIEANFNVQMTFYAEYIDQINLVRIPGYTSVNSGLQDDTFNYILEADFTKNEANTKIIEVMQHFKNPHVPFSWWVCPYDKPEDLVIRLERAGLVKAEDNILMYLNLDRWQFSDKDTTLKIKQVTDKKGLIDFAHILVNDEKSFTQYFTWLADVYTADDPIEFYVGYANGKPVVRGQLVFFAQVVGIYYISTAINERRKGYATALQQYLHQVAKDRGFHIVVLQASPEGLPVYLKQGLKECGVFKEFK